MATMSKIEATATIVAVCDWLVASTRECERRIMVFFAYFADGEGTMPDATYYPHYVLNPKLNGTSEKHKLLCRALCAFEPGCLPSECVDALAKCRSEVELFISVLEDYKRSNSLSVSFTCVYDIVEYFLNPCAVKVSAKKRARIMKGKFRKLKESYYENSRVWYDVTTEILSAWRKSHPSKSRSVEEILAKLKGEEAPRKVVIVGAEVAPKAGRRAEPRKRQAVSVARAAKLLATACEKAMLADLAVGERTFRR